MGYLDNSSVTVDAVLTKKGRELLAQGQLNITKFCLGDDEIDYGLYDTSHNLGSAYYGEAIERMPVLEAFTNDTQTLKYKLVTLPKNTQVLPVVQLPISSVTLETSQVQTITPSTANVSNANATNGYSFTIANTDIVQVVLLGQQTVSLANPRPGFEGTTQTTTGAVDSSYATGYQSSYTVNGFEIELKGLSLVSQTTTTLSITGNDTGGTITIPVTVKADPALKAN